MYEYVIYSLIITVSLLFLVILISGIMGKLCEVIIIIIPFMVLRKSSGEFHASKAGTCFAGSCALLFLYASAVSYVTCNLILKVLEAGAAISLCIFSLVNSENLRLSDNEKIIYKRATWFIVMFFMIVFILFLVTGKEMFAKCIATGLMLPACL